MKLTGNSVITGDPDVSAPLPTQQYAARAEAAAAAAEAALASLRDGYNGWSPVLAIVADGERRVFQVIDWQGGESTKPATERYVGSSGLVDTAAEAIDIRGAAGVGGPAATVSIGAVTTLPPGSSATVTNSGTSSAAVLNIGIPAGVPGDVAGPAGATAGTLALFDGTTGKLLKSSGFAPREVLTQNRIYYVSTSGSDSNNGLTSGTAFATIAKALAVAASLDCSIYNLTIQAGAGIWTVPVVLPLMIGSGVFTLLGDPTTPSNVIISTTSADAVSFTSVGPPWTINGFRLQTASFGSALYAGSNALLKYANIDFGACFTSHVKADNGGFALAVGNTSISGNALIHWFSNTGGLIVDIGLTITLTGTRAFSNAFLQASGGSIVKVNGNTFVGTATGTRYSVASNAVADVNGAGASYLPGSSAGSASTGGQYV